MSDPATTAPRRYDGVMISSTFTDLKTHREAIARAISRSGFKTVQMEDDTARTDADLIDASLQMVRDSAAYAVLIGRKYGQVPRCPDRNPDGLSITELEFDEAQRLRRPTLLFIMDPKHPVPEAAVELDPAKRVKLDAFRERTKRMRAGSDVERIYSTFDSLEHFVQEATLAVAKLRLPPAAPPPAAPTGAATRPIPAPPAFYAAPPYIGRHHFFGRQAQLDTLNDWAAEADPNPLLLFEAIGGTGKSMLTWHWANRDAPAARPDWAGRFWYSFYERGAVMADFCRHGLAYVTGQPLEAFSRRPMADLAADLLAHLQTRPWLFVLDGLERVLVSYHRADAAQLADEDAGGSDPIAQRRDPCDCIRPENDELLRALAAAAPSKLLVTSRLVPRTLLNASGQPLPGVRHERLPGLRPADAEDLFRDCDVKGESAAMRSYLQAQCDCHPLTIGVLAGLVTAPGPRRGNFDAWLADPARGGSLNLADLDLVQKRNHILRAALEALPEKGRQLLSTLALLSEAADYAVLSALNPHLPPEPEEVETPDDPAHQSYWRYVSDERKQAAGRQYEAQQQRHADYVAARAAWAASAEFRAAPRALTETVADLERRGLLQYDRQADRYDLHPVVRGVAAGGLAAEDTNRYGQRIVDHFSRHPHRPYADAETLDDVRAGLQVIRTLQRMGRWQEAADVYVGDLSEALSFNLDAYAEIVALLKPFFPQGWRAAAQEFGSASYIASSVGIALNKCGFHNEAVLVHGNILLFDIDFQDWLTVRVSLSNLGNAVGNQGRLAAVTRFSNWALDLAELLGDSEAMFRSHLDMFELSVTMGAPADAERIWALLDPMGRDWHRAAYRPGDAERLYARFRYQQGTLTQPLLDQAERLALAGRNRWAIRSIRFLTGAWRAERGEWAPAAESLREAVRMAREVGDTDARAETMLALAQFHLGDLPDPRETAARLGQEAQVNHLSLARLWHAIGDAAEATRHAKAAYEEAWADGEPYVFRHELDQATALLRNLGAPIPSLPPYDPKRDARFPWEDKVVAAIAQLRAEKAAEAGKTGPAEE